jgi:hypothetical protein
MRRLLCAFAFAITALFVAIGPPQPTAARPQQIQCGPYVQPGVCSPRFAKDQQVQIRSGVPFVWLRKEPSSSAQVVGTVVYSVGATLKVAEWPSRWDGYQNWWLVTPLPNSQVAGWVEQASLIDQAVAPDFSQRANWTAPFTGSIRGGVPFVWIRNAPDSYASVQATLLPWDRFTVLGTPQPVYDGRQWWWYVSARTLFGIRTGYVEQNSIVGARTMPQPPTTTPVPSGPQLVSFSASPSLIDRGGSTTLNWNVTNAVSVTVWRLDTAGRLVESHTAQSGSGSWTLQLPSESLNSVEFRLYATGTNGATTEGSVAVQVRCPNTYFFNPPWTSCPQAPAAQVQAAFQQFENGFMVWRGDTNTIYVFVYGGHFASFVDTWKEGETYTLRDTPPTGRYAPTRGFGKVWFEARQSGNNLLGWATVPERAYTAYIQQSSESHSRIFISLPDRQVMVVVESSWNSYSSF